MNSADRSLTPLDTALRRRFEFVEVMPEPGLLGPVDGVDVPQLLDTINQRIEALIGRDHVIGHAYFLPIKNLDDLRQVFLNRIIPLLAEYFFEDWSKIRLVLADHLKPAEQQMVQEVNTDAQALFGPAPVHLLPRHRINPALQQADGAFAQPDAYRTVY
jgi:5-methylcytosine-specific restriction protein B